jgi:DNA-binding LytR/AlgR family response regulator
MKSKKEKTIVSKSVSEVAKPIENNHCTLLEFEEGTIILEMVQEKTWLVIQYREIMSVSVSANYCSFHLKSVLVDVVFKISLTKLRKILPANYFWFVHHSHLVGRKHIFKFIEDDDGGAVIVLNDLSKIDVAPAKKKNVKNTLSHHAHFLAVKEIKLIPKTKTTEKTKKDNI